MQITTVETHISDQSAVFGTQVISCSPREALYVLDGLLANNTIVPIREHTRPVSSNGPETYAKQLALSYAFDLWRVFQQCCQGIAATFCSKSSRGGSFWIVDTGMSSGTYIVLKNHCFSTPNTPFQNRSFSGLMTP